MNINDEEEISLNLKKSTSFREEDLDQINILPLFSKISVAQALLKEMVSIKERFDENKNKMIEKIQQNCYTYYKSLITSKEIYDKCKLSEDDKSERMTYALKNNSEKEIDKYLYKPIYNFLFLLRNNNKYMLRLLSRCHRYYFDQLSYFLAHFCYENTINRNNSFVQEELQLIIYFLIEKVIYKNPEEILTYGGNTILYKLLENIITKVDINNYLNELLCDLIIQIDKDNNNLDEVENKEIKENKENNDDKKNLKKIYIQKGKENDDTNFNENDKEFSFFIKNDTPFTLIIEQLNYFINLKEKDQITWAMIYFLKMIAEVDEDPKKSNIYRNYYYFGFLLTEKKFIREKKFEEIRKSYDLIQVFIASLIIKIEESLSNIPQPLQNILNVLDILIRKKMSQNENEEKVIFYILMAKIRVLIGNIILPMIKLFYSVRIINNHILSKSTVEILKSIELIFNNLLQGKLFECDNNPEYTIYNKLIISILPKLLKISLNIGLNRNNTNSDKDFFSILLKLTETFDDINNTKRIINYEELKNKDMHNENIEYQSICFNWEILSDLIKTLSTGPDIFINEYNTKEENNIFKDILKLNYEIYLLSKNQYKKEIEYYLIDKIIYKNEFDQKIKSIIQDNFELMSKSDINGEVERFKKCLTQILGYVGVLHKEDFLPFITPKEKIQIYSNSKTRLLLNYKKYHFYQDNNKMNVENPMKRHSLGLPFLRDRFFSRRKSVVNPFLSTKNDENIDFKTELFPQIMSLVKIELGNNFDCEKFQRIIFCLSYVQTNFDNIPIEYKNNNYSLLFIEIIRETKIFIQELQNNILNEFIMKIRNIEKINEIIKKSYIKNKNIEKYFYIKYLYKRARVYGNIYIDKNQKGMITKIKFEAKPKEGASIESINSFLLKIPNFVDYESKIKENLLEYEEKIGLADTINEYFKELRNTVKKIKILSKLTIEEFLQVLYELENYILKKLHSKFYPKKKSKEDVFLYKKCSRLSFIKPDNIIKDKKFKNINEKLLEISIDYVKEVENQLTPMDKINSFGKAMNFLSNSMEFNSGKKDFGVDDLLPLLIYIIIKSRPERFHSNYNYCMLYLNNDLKKKQYGSLLTQIGVILEFIKNMKCNDLINVTEEQFGVDEKE